MNVPVLTGFNFKGGVNFSPEFTALLLGLVLYTAAFVAEVVRAGIQSVSHGQTEAAMAIGTQARPDPQPGHSAPGPAGYYSAVDQSDAESHQKQLPGGGYRISGFCFRGRHGHQPDRPGHRRGGSDYDLSIFF